MTAMTKCCTKCGINKPLSEYYEHPTSHLGRTARCISCLLVEHRQYKLKTRPSGPREARAKRAALLAEGLKECKGCHETKPTSKFYPVAKGRPASYCKACDLARAKAWATANREHRNKYTRDYMAVPENRERRIQTRRIRISATPQYTMQITLAHGLKRKHTQNPATIEDLMQKWRDQDGRCALTGIKMTWGQGTVLPTSLSLDRIDWRKGYSADNIRLICHAVNAFRGRMSDTEMIEMARAIVDHDQSFAGQTRRLAKKYPGVKNIGNAVLSFGA